MRNVLCAALLTVAFSSPATADDLTCSPAVLAHSWELLREAGWGTKKTERAAFVVRAADGAISFVTWPTPTESYRADYLGQIPSDAVAIIHTHPNDVPQPSDGDSMTATRTGLPVYVLTRTRIMRDTAGAIATIWVGDWNPTSNEQAHTSCHASTLSARLR